MNYAIFFTILFFAVLILPELAFSQVPPPPPDAPNQTPIDGGLGILAVAGGAYALNKLRRSKK